MDARNIKFPETLIEAVCQFSDLDNATEFFANIRWANGVCCPRCGSTNVLHMPKNRLWECRENHPRKQFSVKVGTVFEDCKLTVDKCLIAVWLKVNAKNSISSYEVHRHLGITQKTAWFLQQRIRFAMHQGSFDKMGSGGSSIVEADETFIGGKARNMHKGKRKAKGTGAVGKAAVMGLLERHKDKSKPSQVRTHVVGNTKRSTLKPIIQQHVEPGTEIHTDALKSYIGLDSESTHRVVDHAECYVNDNVHTNGLENFWSLFKRCIKGTHISVEPFHLFRYLDSKAFRFNNRESTDGIRFMDMLKGVQG